MSRCIASAPTVTGSAFIRRFRLSLRHWCFMFFFNVWKRETFFRQIWPNLFNWFFSSARVGYWDAKTMSLFSLKVRDSQRWNIALLWSVLPALNTKRENSCQNIDPDYRTHEWTQPYKRDLYKREGKGRRCCLGNNILLGIGWTNPFLYVIQVQLILFFISTWCKKASKARS